MDQEEQQDTPSEDPSGLPEWPDDEQFSGVPPSEFLFTYLQQRADSLSVTQSDLKDLLATESQAWILTRATDGGRGILAEASIWTVATLGEMRSQNLLLLLLRNREEIQSPPHSLLIPRLGGASEDDLTTIVSASVVRFHPKRIEKMRQQAHPLLITKISESKAFAVFYDDRYHSADGTKISSLLGRDIANFTEIGSWLNKATELIIVNNQTGRIVDYSLKDEKTLLAAVTEERTQNHQIGIFLAMAALAGLLAFNAAPGSLSALVANGIGLAAFGILFGTMLHSDLIDG